jgi:hypothetical protein
VNRGCTRAMIQIIQSPAQTLNFESTKASKYSIHIEALVSFAYVLPLRQSTGKKTYGKWYYRLK